MAKTTVERPAEDHIQQNELVSIFRMMLLTRRLEESVYRLFRDAKIGGYLHRYDGQEAIVAGVIPQLKLPGDYVLCTYRDHAHALFCGTPAKEVMAELLGRATGCAGGKGGSMHLTDPERGFLGGDGIVGGPVPISAGVGYALKYKQQLLKGDANICVCYFGDGAMNQGGVHEAFNMVGLYNLPVLYILENNQYAMGTSVERSTGQPDFVLKAKAHGIAGEKVDGMNVLTVHEAAKKAIARIRKTGEAYFLEMDCYRFVGHGIGDDNTKGWATYRTESEVDEWRKRDPILQLGEHLEKIGVLNDAQIDKIEAEVRREVEEAIAFADASPEPPLDSLYENVFS
jgi:pyruvate dehydrogenase E1 component alpha subunit